MELTKEQRDLLESLRSHQGWSVVESLLEDRNAKLMKELRNIRKAGISYDRAVSKLDENEWTMKIVDRSITEFDRTREQKNQKQEE